jgi:hypothetical protein
MFVHRAQVPTATIGVPSSENAVTAADTVGDSESNRKKQTLRLFPIPPRQGVVLDNKP